MFTYRSTGAEPARKSQIQIPRFGREGAGQRVSDSELLMAPFSFFSRAQSW